MLVRRVWGGNLAQLCLGILQLLFTDSETSLQLGHVLWCVTIRREGREEGKQEGGGEKNGREEEQWMEEEMVMTGSPTLHTSIISL